MIEIKDKTKCVGCRGCEQICPTNCISMYTDDMGFQYPAADSSKCISCGLCEKVCPVINQGAARKGRAFATINHNEPIRKSSSSGGLFHHLAHRVIDCGGIVFGAAFDKHWNVVHTQAGCEKELEALMRSKYTQSDVNTSFTDIRKYLREGRQVLFSGTPCQVAALRLFLRKDYRKQLFTVDVACHGCPSPRVWQEYLGSIIEKMKRIHGDRLEIKSISFRDKRISWGRFGLAIRFTGTTADNKDRTVEFFETHRENAFMQGFLTDLYIRPSCYNCPARCGKSGADITIADFWGIKEVLPSHYDRDGVSLAIVYDGDESRLEGLDIAECDYDKAVAHNKALVTDNPRTKWADEFESSFAEDGVKAIGEVLSKMRPDVKE